MGFMTSVNKQFRQIHSMECQDLKEGLVEMELADTGRIPLKHFWAKRHIGSWELRESMGYLRQLGALDETSPVPKVIIPNYVAAISNCDAYSEYFSVCCVQECEALLGRIEAQIRAPSSKPAQILDLVANLSSTTITAPRSIPEHLVDALNQVADFHGGDVPLHGRLFAQWLHFAFPRECPYPHMSSTQAHSPLMPEEFQKQAGGQMTTGQDEYDKVMQAEIEGDIAGELSMWTLEEEMRTGGTSVSQSRNAAATPWLIGSVQLVAGAVVLMSLARSVVSASQRWSGGPAKPFMKPAGHCV